MSAKIDVDLLEGWLEKAERVSQKKGREGMPQREEVMASAEI